MSGETSTTTPTVVHVATVDMSLELLLGPQLEAIREAGYRVIGASAPGPYVEALARRGVEHVALDHATRAMSPVDDARALAELVRLFRRVQPAIVHTHNPKPGLYGRIAARIARVPVIVNTIHGLYTLPEDPWLKRAVVYGLERLAATCSHAELVQSPEDLPTLRRLRVPAERLTLLGNGIDLGRFDPAGVPPDERAAARRELGATGDDVVVGVVGRLVREKGHPEVFEAAALLATRAPAVRVAVIGPDEPDKADSLTPDDRRVAEQAGVRFLGPRDDVVRLYAGMDVFVLASHREGFPRTPMEAAAMGVPVVATDIRGCRQVVDHDATGLLVPVRDPAALADAVGRLAADPAARRRLGAAAREKARKDFDQRRVVDLTLATYERLLARAGLTPPTPSPGRERSSARPTASVARQPSTAAGNGRVTAGLRPGQADDARAVAALHAERIGEGFLVTLGPRFLTRLYRRIARSPHAVLLVAADGGRVVGFVAAATDTHLLYREFLRRDAVPAGLAAAPAVMRSPRRVWETLRYGTAGDGTGDLPAAEVLSVAVAADAGGRGLGGALLEATLEELSRMGIRSARVVTAVGNDAALAMYQRAGFHRHGHSEVHAGVPQELLVRRTSS